MRILGIDPGLNATGFGVVDAEGSTLLHVASGTITISPAQSLPSRLNELFDSVGEIVAEYRPYAVAVEDTFLAKNVAVALKLGQAKGVVMLAAERAGLLVTEYAPTEIKTAVTGFGAAAKEQVRAMVGRLLGLDVGAATHHATDALATAICHVHSSGPLGNGRATSRARGTVRV